MHRLRPGDHDDRRAGLKLVRAQLLPSPGRTPWNGHFRGVVQVGMATLSYAGRLRHSTPPEEGWAAAEAARDALSGLAAPGDPDRHALIELAWAAMRTLDHRDLSLLLVADDVYGTTLAASGLSMVRADELPLVEAEHPLLGEPGVPDRVGFFTVETPARQFVGVPR